MAFLNGKYTAFDPQITIEDINDDDENCVVFSGSAHFDLVDETITFSNLDKSVADISDASTHGKRIVVFFL